MKVDIQGSDFQTLHSITAATAPAYVSLELNYADPIVERLIELGYSAFKFVNGETYWPRPSIFDHQIGWRLLRKNRADSSIRPERDQQASAATPAKFRVRSAGQVQSRRLSIRASQFRPIRRAGRRFAVDACRCRPPVGNLEGQVSQGWQDKPDLVGCSWASLLKYVDRENIRELNAHYTERSPRVEWNRPSGL